MTHRCFRQLGLLACLGLLLGLGSAPAGARQINLAPTPDQDGTGQQTDPNSLAGSWLGSLTDDQGQRHNLTLILTETDYTFSNACNEVGSYAVVGTAITFTPFMSDCESSLGGAQVAVSDEGGSPSKTYEFTRQSNTVTIHGVEIGGKMVDLTITLNQVEVWKVIGRGVISVLRYRDWGIGGWDRVTGEIPFSIHRGPDRDVVEGEGKLDYFVNAVAAGTGGPVCTTLGIATGKAVLSGVFYSEPACELADLVISDYYYWTPMTITSLTGQCEGLSVGDTWPQWVPTKSNWMEFPLVAGEVVHKMPLPDAEDYILKEIQVDLDATGCVAAP